ncbi:MAG: DUF4931 domain-containing protein [Candidatus Nanoarchaeia archaeon]
MVELRKDYILDRYVIVASERAKRPHDFKNREEEAENGQCFFCPGNEHKTPPEIARIEGKKVWAMRVFENKFPAVQGNGKTELETHNEYFTFADAVGRHEIIVETPEHKEQLWDFSPTRMKKLFLLYQDRISVLENEEGVKYVSLFKNHGKEGGASLMHSHTQVIAYNLIPTEIMQKEQKSRNVCPYCKIIEKEKDSLRKISENEAFVSFTPYASRFLFEAWVFPKRHVVSIKELNKGEIQKLVENIRPILKKLKESNAPYNMYLQEGAHNMHFHIIIAPRLANWAGFELSTGTVINPVSPEDAAEFYRNKQ